MFDEVGIDTGRKIEAIYETVFILASINNDNVRSTYIEEVTNVLKKHNVAKNTLLSALRTVVKTQDEEENLTVDGESLPTYLSDKDKRDYFKYGFYEGLKGNDLNQYFFGPGKRASNFVIRPIFHISDTSNPRKLFELVNKYGLGKKIDIDMQEMTSLQSFRKTVEGQGNFIFEGNEGQFMKIRAKLYDNTVFCENVSNLGWQKQGFWAWANGIQTSDGFVKVDDDGVVKHDEVNYYIPAYSQIYIHDKTMFAFERKFKLIENSISINDWAELFQKVYRHNGAIGIAFWTASVFRDHLITFYNNFPLLNLFGPKGTGKSQMASALMHLYGEPQPFYNIHNGTVAALAESLANFNNGLVWIEEYKNSIEFQKIENLKQIYDNQGRSRMSMGDSKRKGRETTPINSAAMITGQEMPTADIALFSRVIFLKFNQSEFTDEDRSNFDMLAAIQRKGLSQLTNEMIKHREFFEKEFYYVYQEVMVDIRKGLDEAQVTDRIYRNWAMILAAWKTISKKIRFPFDYKYMTDLCVDGILNQEAQISNSDEIGLFWQLIEAMFEQNNLIQGWDFKIDFCDSLITRQRKIIFNPPIDLLKFKFSSFYKLYAEHGRRMGMKPLPSDTLRYYLENHKHFKGVSKSDRFNYVEFSKEDKGNITNSTTTSAYCFDYDKLNINLKRDQIASEISAAPVAVASPDSRIEKESDPF